MPNGLRRRTARLRLTGQATALTALLLAAPPSLAQNALVFTHPEKARDVAGEMRLKIDKPFTVVAVGDMIQQVPFARRDDPDVQHLLDIMRNADVTFANNENTILDRDTFRGVVSHMDSPPAVADDWAAMGIDIVSRANNHTFDAGDEGVAQNSAQLRRVGIEHTGVGHNAAEARMTRFVSTPKGTVGLMSVYARNSVGGQLYGLPRGEPVYVTADQLKQLRAMRDSMLARRGEVAHPIALPKDAPGEVLVFGINFKAGKPGDKVIGEASANDLMARMSKTGRRHEEITDKANELKLRPYISVTPAQLAQLRAIAGDKGGGDELTAWGVGFRARAKPGEYIYEMDAQNLRDLLREVRTGKQFYDFQAATIHWHQNRYAFQAYSFDHYPSDYQVKFARAMIDQGADMFFGHGVHTLRGVEIYKGKPIFYGLSNFVWQPQNFRSWRDYGDQPEPAPLTGPVVGEGEYNEQHWHWLQHPANLVALVAESRYDKGQLKEVRLHPADLGVKDRPWSQFGMPKRPSPEVARQILEQVAEYSKPFGTKIAIENGVGVIRVP